LRSGLGGVPPDPLPSEHPVLRWDMIRARDKGRIVYRHLAGLLRVVRGSLMLKAVSVAALGRPSITATFMCDTAGPDDPPPLHDAHLVHADETRLVLSGYARVNIDQLLSVNIH
jgi:hypothetical protein